MDLLPESSPILLPSHRPFPRSLHPNVARWRFRCQIHAHTRAPAFPPLQHAWWGHCCRVCGDAVRFEPPAASSPSHLPIPFPLVPPPFSSHIAHLLSLRRWRRRRCPHPPRPRVHHRTTCPRKVECTRHYVPGAACAHSRPRSARTPCACRCRCRAFVVHVDSPRAPTHTCARTDGVCAGRIPRIPILSRSHRTPPRLVPLRRRRRRRPRLASTLVYTVAQRTTPNAQRPRRVECGWHHVLSAVSAHSRPTRCERRVRAHAAPRVRCASSPPARTECARGAQYPPHRRRIPAPYLSTPPSPPFSVSVSVPSLLPFSIPVPVPRSTYTHI
ncbi:hypothetical protein B0H16DRAFT_328456 [Mycena metata]|uniref:Uncharacterized protein n=1 Tax=Mycena metata TaxID=1033252 RepID=A0AAD7HNY4_9AGAR|nr:hypothetical protein B0H16DRAFT_328456 [Mycena metata]